MENVVLYSSSLQFIQKEFPLSFKTYTNLRKFYVKESIIRCALWNLSFMNERITQLSELKSDPTIWTIVT